MYPLLSATTPENRSAIKAPLLIVGAPRTGSSFLVEALAEVGGFVGSAEGHVTPLMAEIDLLVRGYYAQMQSMGLLDIPENTITKIPKDALVQELMSVFDRFHAQIFPGESRLLDKTVNVAAIGALPFLLGVWPKAKILYLKRNGIDNVISAQKYFGVSLEDATRNWAFCGEEWDRVVGQLPKGSFLIVDHDDLVANPVAVADKVAQLVELPSSRASRFREFVVQRTKSWTSSRPERKALTELDWSPKDLWTFVSIGASQMISQGYSTPDEIARVRGFANPGQVPLSADRVRVLSIDDPRLFQPAGDGYFIVPGRDRAAMLVYENVATAGMSRLAGQLLLQHPASQNVRVEVIVLSRDDGHLVVNAAFELQPLVPVDISLPLDSPGVTVDVLLRVVIGQDSSRNDYSWVRVSSLVLV